MINMLTTKTRAVLKKSSIMDDFVSYEAEYIDTKGVFREAVISVKDWEELGKPEEITVTIEPGDKLTSET